MSKHYNRKAAVVVRGFWLLQRYVVEVGLNENAALGGKSIELIAVKKYGSGKVIEKKAYEIYRRALQNDAVKSKMSLQFYADDPTVIERETKQLKIDQRGNISISITLFLFLVSAWALYQTGAVHNISRKWGIDIFSLTVFVWFFVVLYLHKVVVGKLLEKNI